MAGQYSRRLADVDAAMVAWAKVWQSGLIEEIGWNGGIMAQWIDYQGQPPRGTGNDQSNLGMIRALQKMEQEDVAAALRVKGALDRALLDAHKPVALLMIRYLQGGTKKQRARQAGLSIEVYSVMVDCAMELVAGQLQTRRVA